MRVYLGSDHAGFGLKQELSSALGADGHELVDVGPAEFDPEDDYPPFCVEVARRAVADQGSLGIVIGGSGNGEQIAANKVPGARAALAWNTEVAQLAREHNNAQIVGIGARMHETGEAIAIVRTFLATPFSAGQRHERRIEMLRKYESTGEPPALP